MQKGNHFVLYGIIFLIFSLVILEPLSAQVPDKIPDVLTVIHNRKSVRKYLDKPVSEEQLEILLDMLVRGCEFGHTYYFYREEGASENAYFHSYREAEAHLVDQFTGAGKKWDDMSNEELAEWIEELDMSREEPFRGRKHVNSVG